MELGELRNMKVTVNIAEALKILKKNLDKHNKDHAKAMKGWNKKVAVQAGKAAKSAKAGKLTETPGDLAHTLRQRPQSYAAAYEASIAMFGHHTEETIELNSSDYDKLMRDNWEWRETFAMTNSLYGVGQRR